MKECTGSYVVYIQDNLVEKWKQILERHLGIHKFDNIRVIFKCGEITITLYRKPKKDPRSKLHIQSKDKEKNLEFILESLSRFYNEVCSMPDVSQEAINYKELQRSLCAKCGKYFTNKKGLKQHVLRMHSSLNKRMNKDKAKHVASVTIEQSNPSPRVTLEEEVVVSSVDEDTPSNMVPEQESVRIISGPTQMIEIRSPHPKKLKTNSKDKEETDNTVFIKTLLGELLDQCSNEIESNYQCGECAKTFYEEKDSLEHMDKDHSGCHACIISEKEERVLRDLIEDKDEQLKELLEKNNNLTKKNTAMDRETKRLTLAFNQSLHEKEVVRKELNVTCESLNDALKQNTTLNDELKVKTDLINIMRDNGSQSEADDNSVPTTNSGNQRENEKDNGSTEEDDRIQCKECDFKTRVRKYMKSHKMVHEGQYQCQRGCRDTFKTWRILDEHHKNKHSPTTKETEVFKCDVCSSTFLSKQHLRHHIEAKHSKQTNPPKSNVKCEQCGFDANNHDELVLHIDEYHRDFQQQFPNRICRHFLNGGCSKGQFCRYSHPTHNDVRRTPHCRNGPGCRFLANGVCSFFHRGFGVQQKRKDQQPKVWCNYMETAKGSLIVPLFILMRIFPSFQKPTTLLRAGTCRDGGQSIKEETKDNKKGGKKEKQK